MSAGEVMKLIFLYFFSLLPFLVSGQTHVKYDYPDTLWIYGQAGNSDYGFTPENPIKVGGGILPKHSYRYLNSLTDKNGKKVTYERIGSCCNDVIKRTEPLTSFLVRNGKNEFILYLDQYEWEKPQLIQGFGWEEKRSGYYGEFINDTIFHGYGLYFFDDGGYYRGSFIDGIMDGNGEMHIPEQEKYVGEFKDGKYHGFGTLFYFDGGKYEGNWANGLREGFGKLYYPPDSDVNYMEGNFEAGTAKGYFKIFNRNGTEESYDF